MYCIVNSERLNSALYDQLMTNLRLVNMQNSVGLCVQMGNDVMSPFLPFLFLLLLNILAEDLPDVQFVKKQRADKAFTSQNVRTRPPISLILSGVLCFTSVLLEGLLPSVVEHASILQECLFRHVVQKVKLKVDVKIYGSIGILLHTPALGQKMFIPREIAPFQEMIQQQQHLLLRLALQLKYIQLQPQLQPL